MANTYTQIHIHAVFAVNGMPDHVYVFFGMRPVQSLSDLMQDIKGGSSKWINDKKFIKAKFSWQEGYGAFSYGKSQLSQVIRYIENQEEHHKRKTFIDEYVDFFKLFQIEYDERYIFKPIDY